MSDNYTPGQGELTYVPCACLECDYEKLRDRVPVVEPCASCVLGPNGGGFDA